MTEPYSPGKHGDRRSPDGQLLVIIQHVEDMIERRVGALERRMDELAKSITSWMDKNTHEVPCPYLKDAIPKEDYAGHRKAHEDDMEWKDMVKKLRFAVVMAVVVTGSVGFLGWFAILLWAGVLKGPVL